MKFFVEQRVLDLGVKILFARADAIANGESPPELKQLLQNETVALRAQGPAALEHPVLKGFRTLHERVGKTGKKWASSPENMIAMILQGRDLPSLSRAVDCYNIVSLRSKLAFGAHDCAKTEGNVTLRLTDASENYFPIGAKEADRVAAGEYAYCDDSNTVLCRLEIRQVEKTKVTPASTSVFYVIQGNPNTEMAELDAAFEALQALTQEHCGGTFTRIVPDVI